MTAKTENAGVLPLLPFEARISKSILPTYGTFPCGRSDMLKTVQKHNTEISIRNAV